MEEETNEEQKVKTGFLKKVSSNFKKLWNNTVFPEMIKNKKERKDWERKIKHQAELQAIEENKSEFVKHYKQKMIDKLKGKKKTKGKDFLEKLAKGFEGSGSNMDSKIANGFGFGGKQNNTNPMGSGDLFSEEKMNQMLGTTTVTKKKTKKTSKKKQQINSMENKIKRMLE